MKKKDEKQNSNGAVGVQYVLLEFVMPLWFHSMFQVKSENTNFALNFAVDKWMSRTTNVNSAAATERNLSFQPFRQRRVTKVK